MKLYSMSRRAKGHRHAVPEASTTALCGWSSPRRPYHHSSRPIGCPVCLDRIKPDDEVVLFEGNPGWRNKSEYLLRAWNARVRAQRAEANGGR